jgi:hypothetical protein
MRMADQNFPLSYSRIAGIVETYQERKFQQKMKDYLAEQKRNPGIPLKKPERTFHGSKGRKSRPGRRAVLEMVKRNRCLSVRVAGVLKPGEAAVSVEEIQT